MLSPEPLALPAGHPPARLPALLLVPPGGAYGGGGVALSELRQLSIQWPGAAVLCFASAPPLTALQRLSLPDGTDLVRTLLRACDIPAVHAMPGCPDLSREQRAWRASNAPACLLAQCTLEALWWDAALAEQH